MSEDCEASAPLLANIDNHGRAHSPSHPEQPTGPQTPPQPITRTVLTFMTLHFLLGFSEMILIAPIFQLQERSICTRYYQSHPKGPPDRFHGGGGGGIDDVSLPGDLCKISEVYGLLARVRGFKYFLDALPVLLVAVPLGAVGDRFGRRWVLGAAVVGAGCAVVEMMVVLAFPNSIPVEWIYLSSVFLLCGGGFYSAAAFMWAMAAEAIPEDKRSYAFYHIFSAFYIAEMAASGVAALTLDISPWIGCFLSLISIILCLILLYFIPSTSGNKHDSSLRGQRFDSSVLVASFKSAWSSIRAAANNRNILLLLPVFLVGTLRYSTLSLVMIYTALRWNVSIARGATYYTETAIINIVLFLVVVPQLTRLFRERYHKEAHRIDAFLVRLSVSLLCLGALAIALSPSAVFIPFSLAIYAAGFGSRVSAIALISYLVPDEAKATIYAAIAVLENLGHAVGDPSLSFLFSAGLGKSFGDDGSPGHLNAWIALPFFVAAGLYALARISTVFLKVEKAVEQQEAAGIFVTGSEEDV